MIASGQSHQESIPDGKVIGSALLWSQVELGGTLVSKRRAIFL
jgi:hypothetical protein